MLHRRQGVFRILPRRGGVRAGGIVQQVAGVFRWHPVDPLVISQHRAAQSHAVLLHYITYGPHTALGQVKARFAPVASPPLPVLSPTMQGRPQVAEPLQ